MRYSEIQQRPAAPSSHPFVADIILASAGFSNFERLVQSRPDIRLLWRLDRRGLTTVHVACASAATRQWLRDLRV
jgi:hypothetical protein